MSVLCCLKHTSDVYNLRNAPLSIKSALNGVECVLLASGMAIIENGLRFYFVFTYYVAIG